MTDELTVLSTGQRQTDMTGEMAEQIMHVIGEYDGRVSTAGAVGVLEIIKNELLNPG